MKVAVAGGTGFIGKALVQALADRGDDVWIVSRSRGEGAYDGRIGRISWEELSRDASPLRGTDAIVNLSGETINQRWTPAAKQRILESRIWSAARVAELVQALGAAPGAVVNASGSAVYGSEGDTLVDEESPTAETDYLSEVARQWEAAADEIPAKRLVKLRIGVVLDRKGGAFPLMALPSRFFGGGRIGSGKQPLSWIHIDDMVRLILFCLDHQEISGPVNASAPDPVTNDEFGRAVGRAMGRPHWLPVPAFAMKALFGEMSVLLLGGQRVWPKKALDNGFEFRYPTLDSALRQLTGSPRP